MRPNDPANLKEVPVKDAETEQTTASQEDKQPVASLLSQPTAFAEEQWKRASNMLRTNPTLVTSHILCMALRHRPPLHVIQFMLHLNSKAASIPKKGPTPLQVAIQHVCSVDVIKALIQACPFALVATNPGSYLDPLSYVKRFRPDESDLIGLLSLPLSHWLCNAGGNAAAAGNTTSTSTNIDSKPSTPSNASTHSYKSAATAPHPTQPHQSSATPSGLNSNYNYNPIRSTLSVADRQELNNVKTLCASVMKGHKRLSREMEVYKGHVASTLPSANATTNATAVSSAETSQRLLEQQQTLVEKHQEQNCVLLKEMQGQQQKNFRVQLIALDMKEKAMRAHVNSMEHRIVQQVLEYNKNALPLQPPPPTPPQLGMDEAYKSVIRTLQIQVQVFQRRLEQVEGHMKPRAGYVYQARSLPGNYGESSQHQRYNHPHNNTKYQLSYRSRCNDTDTACSASVRSSSGSSMKVAHRQGGTATAGASVSAMAIVFATPLPEAVVKNQDDDSLSLLTEDLHVTRHGYPHAANKSNNHGKSNRHGNHPQPFWWVPCMGRRCWLVMVH